MTARWEAYGDQCQRMRVPGGWLYRTWTEGGGVQAVFVPAEAELRDSGFDIHARDR